MSSPKITFHVWKRGNRLKTVKLPVSEALALFKAEREAYVLSSLPIPEHGINWRGQPKRDVCYMTLEGITDVLPLDAEEGKPSKRSGDQELFGVTNEAILREVQKERNELAKKAFGWTQWLWLGAAFAGVVDVGILLQIWLKSQGG